MISFSGIMSSTATGFLPTVTRSWKIQERLYHLCLLEQCVFISLHNWFNDRTDWQHFRSILMDPPVHLRSARVYSWQILESLCNLVSFFFLCWEQIKENEYIYMLLVCPKHTINCNKRGRDLHKCLQCWIWRHRCCIWLLPLRMAPQWVNTWKKNSNIESMYLVCKTCKKKAFHRRTCSLYIPVYYLFCTKLCQILRSTVWSVYISA